MQREEIRVKSTTQRQRENQALAILTLALFIFPSGLFSAYAARQERDVRPLDRGEPIERKLTGGEAHFYEVALSSGQYLHVIVNQRGIDVVVLLQSPDGKKLAEVDSPNGAAGPEILRVVADASGSYQLEVRSVKRAVADGLYDLRIQELRAATGRDEGLVAAERALAEAERLRGRDKPEYLRQAIEKYEEALVHWKIAGDDAGAARTLLSAAGVHSNLGEKQKALEYCDRSIAIFHAAEDRRGEALSLDAAGEVCRSTGDIQQALDYFSRALPLFQAVSDRAWEASTLYKIGWVTLGLGEMQKAREYYVRSLSLFRAVQDRGWEARMLVAIGVLELAMGEPQKALASYEDSLQVWRAMGNRSGEAQTFINIGKVHDRIGDPQKALESFDQALNIWRAGGNRSGEAIGLTEIGKARLTLGEKQAALDAFNRVLELVRPLNDQRRESFALSSVAQAYLSMGEKQKAIDHFTQARSLLQAVGDRRSEASVLSDLGRVYQSMGESNKAADAFNESLSILRSLGFRRGEASALLETASFERDRGNLPEARAYIESAIGIIESLRAGFGSQESRAAYFASVRPTYELYIDLLMRLHRQRPSEGYLGRALQASERARARSVVELLAEARADIRQGVDPALLQRERMLQQQVNARADYQLRLAGDRSTEQKALAVRKEIEGLMSQYQEVLAQIRTKSPRYAGLTQPQPLSLDEIQQHVLDADTLLLEFALGNERSYVWVSSSTSIAGYELPGRAVVEAAARRVYDLLTARQPARGESNQQMAARVAKADADWPAAAEALSQMLLGPAAALLGSKRLLIVTEGALQYVPFPALPVPVINGKTPGTRPLVAEHEIVSAPSASVLAALRRETTGRKLADKTVAVLADPVFDKDDDRAAQASRPARDQIAKAGELHRESEVRRAVREVDLSNAGGGIPRLPFSREEAEAIVGAVPAGKGLKAIGFQASRTTATSTELAQYRIVHFATHSLLNNEHPELSGIVLSLVDEEGRSQDGFLRLHELYNLNLPVELVVLSACQTGLGKDIRGEGLVGLTRGFMYAGAPRVVASLWKVDDWATAELMKEFYRSMLKDGMRPAAALRAAQVAIWKQKRWQAPFYWAGFVLQGEWR